MTDLHQAVHAMRHIYKVYARRVVRNQLEWHGPAAIEKVGDLLGTVRQIFEHLMLLIEPVEIHRVGQPCRREILVAVILVIQALL